MGDYQHQHFIPKSYLKNFAERKGNKFFVEAKSKFEEKPKGSPLSIVDVCVNKNLYTIPNLTDNEKYSLEKFYAEHIDSSYPIIYDLLVNPNVEIITVEQKAQIVFITMSLFFRTPKFLNQQNKKVEAILEYGKKNHMDDNGNINFSFRDYNFDFHIDNLEKEINNLKMKNRLKFLYDHLKDWKTFSEQKIPTSIVVYKIEDDIDLITSDNPVFIRPINNECFNIFSPNNMISLPIDTKHYLTIMPNTVDGSINYINRDVRDKRFALTTNLRVDKSSDLWVLGRPGTVTKHISDQEKDGAHTPENYKRAKEMEEQAADMKSLYDLIGVDGKINQQFLDKVRELKTKDTHKNDVSFQSFLSMLKDAGYKV